jgi:3-hydroxybutyryl-CoA dehydratase
MDWNAPFEDLRAGTRFATAARRVEEHDVLAFAALTGDLHPQHVDPAWAARSDFGERIAHGMLVVALAAGLVPFDPRRVVALRRVADVVFKRPVRLGDSVLVEGEIGDLRALDDDGPGLVTFTWSVRNQHGQLCCQAKVDVLWRRGALDDHDRLVPTAAGAGPLAL